MAFAVFDNDLVGAKRMQRVAMALFDLPSKGRHTGRGRHVAMKMRRPPPQSLRVPGWGTRYRLFVKHPADDGRLAMRLKQDLLDQFAAHPEKLTPADQTWLQDQIDNAIELDNSWLTDEGNGVLAPREEEDVPPV